eukprot:TRINITY_DN3011_c0_g1_i1.p1 TRINITY_DN3011_c0_g1~~TRINITY_DN3011_c0_g1_i1.p1  ORF type:complete len:372 (+),score=43.84 TRINITY_DN3011_c0_g1_i1:99-1214(+)
MASVKPIIFVGSYTEKFPHAKGTGEGIYAFEFNQENGTLTPLTVRAPDQHFIGTNETGHNPTYLCTDSKKKILFSVQEIGSGKGSSVNSFSVEKSPSLQVKLLSNQFTSGFGGCHVSTNSNDPSINSNLVFVSHYNSGSFAVLPFSDGKISPPSQKVEFEYKSQDQDGPHAHGIFIDDSTRKYAFVVDLGGDRVYQYQIEGDSLKPNPVAPFIQLDQGAGPRHLVFHPSHRFAYVINELNATISVCKYDPAQGTLSVIQTVSTRGGFKGRCNPAAIRVSADGRALYSSNRFHNSIAVFLINQESGTLEWIQDQETSGEIPRDFDLDPSGKWLLVAHQETDTIVTFKIDPETRKLAKATSVSVNCPTCITFM